MRARDLLYPLRVVKQILYLPKISHHQHDVEQSISTELSSLQTEVTKMSSILEQRVVQIDDIDKLLHVIDSKIIDIKHAVSTATKDKTNPHNSDNLVNNTIADDHSLDSFYKLFEDRFRGSEEDIKQRVSEYKPLFGSLPKKIAKFPVVDLGCGRGEFLSFAKDIGLNAIGIDMNYDMVERANDLGLTAIRTDAVTYISNQKKHSLAAITGFHIVEHIPFGVLMKLFEESYRTLAPGGFALFETPNPKNLTIGASNFYIDPSHIKPIPPELLSFALESVGFKTEILPKHPAKENIQHSDEDVAAMMQVIYGPQDYAVLAKKV